MKKWILLFSLSILFACEKEFSAQEDTEAPEIEIVLPKTFELNAGDTLAIRIHISDNDQLHDFYVGLNNLSAMTKEMHWSNHWHGQSVDLDTMFILPSELSYSHWQLQIQASDHLENRSELRVPIFVLPRKWWVGDGDGRR